MSTRAIVVIKDKYDKLFFYRHSDGYPEGVEASLKFLMEGLRTGKFRDNVSQFSGWLITVGAAEYNTLPRFKVDEVHTGYADMKTLEVPKDKFGGDGFAWKVGAYEPTTEIHGDIEYLYVIDLTNQTCKGYKDWRDNGEGLGDVVANF
jgi:hypothetical protein